MAKCNNLRSWVLKGYTGWTEVGNPFWGTRFNVTWCVCVLFPVLALAVNVLAAVQSIRWDGWNVVDAVFVWCESISDGCGQLWSAPAERRQRDDWQQPGASRQRQRQPQVACLQGSFFSLSRQPPSHASCTKHRSATSPFCLLVLDFWCALDRLAASQTFSGISKLPDVYQCFMPSPAADGGDIMFLDCPSRQACVSV